MYDPSKAGSDLRHRAAAVLGFWHPLKQMMLLLWRRFASCFFAPLLHSLVPGSRFHEKPQLVKLHAVFTYLRLAYPSIRERLHSLREDKTLSVASRSLVINLIDVFEFYIPMVCFSLYFISLISLRVRHMIMLLH
jgi:hypothetical protein